MPASGELAPKAGEGDFLKTEAVPQLRMDAEGLIGAGGHEHSPERLNRRNATACSTSGWKPCGWARVREDGREIFGWKLRPLQARPLWPVLKDVRLVIADTQAGPQAEIGWSGSCPRIMDAQRAGGGAHRASAP